MKTQHRMSSAEFFRMFPDEDAAIAWFEQKRWPGERYGPFCGSTDTAVVPSKKPQPYRATLKGEVPRNVEPGSTGYTDEAAAYRGMREYRHESVAHSAGGMESFRALPKRGCHGSDHQISVEHLSRHVDEFRHRWNNRGLHALKSMGRTIEAMIGRRLTHRTLVDGDPA